MTNGFYHPPIRSQQMNKPILTQDRLKEVLFYDPDTGIFVWRQRMAAHKGQIGDIAGTVKPRGYVNIQIQRRVYQAHRLAWLYVHGEWPAQQIDHINRNPSDNRIANLRDVSASVNRRNCRHPRNVSSIYKGVSRSRGREKWAAQIVYDGRPHYLGIFGTQEEAREAYILEAKRLGLEHLLANADI